jgi:hypothetical protein
MKLLISALKKGGQRDDVQMGTHTAKKCGLMETSHMAGRAQGL